MTTSKSNPISKVFAWAIIAVLGLFFIRACYLDAQLPEKTPAQLRQDAIERQFSAWDGCHLKLRQVVMESLHDPGSFEHIETTYLDLGQQGVRVRMRWSALNAFGGRESYITTALDDLKGSVVLTSTKPI